MIREDADRRLIVLFESIRYEKKWKSLKMGEKLDFIVGMDKSFKIMRKMREDEKIEAITPEFVMFHISERGDNRIRRLRQFFVDVEKRRFTLMLSNSDLNREEIEAIKTKIRGRPATDSETKTFEELRKKLNL